MFQAKYSDDQIGEHTYHNHDNAWCVVAVEGSQHQKMSFGDQHNRNVLVKDISWILQVNVT